MTDEKRSSNLFPEPLPSPLPEWLWIGRVVRCAYIPPVPFDGEGAIIKHGHTTVLVKPYNGDEEVWLEPRQITPSGGGRVSSEGPTPEWSPRIGDGCRVKLGHHEHMGLRGVVTGFDEYSIYMLDDDGDDLSWDRSTIERDPSTEPLSLRIRAKVERLREDEKPSTPRPQEATHKAPALPLAAINEVFRKFGVVLVVQTDDGTGDEPTMLRIDHADAHPLLDEQRSDKAQRSYEDGLRDAAQLIYDTTEIYQHVPDGLRALDDVRGAILERAGRDPKEQGSMVGLVERDTRERAARLDHGQGTSKRVLGALVKWRDRLRKAPHDLDWREVDHVVDEMTACLETEDE